MQQQLVLQFETDDPDEIETVIEIEDLLTDKLAKVATVEGHEIGEGNISLILTADDPLEVWESMERLVEKLTANGPVLSAVAYRPLSSGEYTVIWPDDYEGEFQVG